MCDIKGKRIIEDIHRFLLFKKKNIEIVVFGELSDSSYSFTQKKYYNINDFNKLLIDYKPHLILETSIWQETYSYTLTLAMITQLPILSLKKYFDNTIENRLKNYNKSYFFSKIDDSLIQLIEKVKQDYFYTVDSTIYYPSFWDDYFITNKSKINNNVELVKNKYDITPYAIYFPQFHDIVENNKSFYPGFSDTENLFLLDQCNICEDMENPSLKELNIETIHDYNLEKNKNIIQKQIDIIHDYHLSGFAIYYYWFSTNTITNKNKIMNKVIDHFFCNELNMRNKKVFFIWANENWTNNLAFGTTHEKIENYYTLENIEKN
jgi:hypothetical protein